MSAAPNWLLALLAAVLALAVVNDARSHDWYPRECCSAYDCAPLSPDRVSPIRGGYLIDGIHTVPFSQVRISVDKQYHGCFPKQTPWSLRCFFAPVGGS